MIFEKDLTILIDGNEFSKDMADFNRDDVNTGLPSGNFIHAGLYKPFTELYWEFTTASTTAAVLTGEYFDGTAFVPLPFFNDGTIDFNIPLGRSAFMKWKNPDDWAKTTVAGDDLFWVRFSPDTLITSMGIRGIGILFSDDNELEKEVSTISRFLPDGDISFAPLHQRIVLDIVDAIRNRGQSKRLEDPTNSSIDRIEMITKFDFLDVTQIRQAATYLALAKIFFANSDSPEDNHQIRGLRYKQQGDAALASYWLSLDLNDDGIQDDVEAATDTRIIVQRV